MLDAIPRPTADVTGRNLIHFSMSRGEVGKLSREIVDSSAAFGSVDKTARLPYECIIYNLICAAMNEIRHGVECVVAVSRNRDTYAADPKVYKYPRIRYEDMIAALDDLVSTGFITQQIGYKAANHSKGLRTVIRGDSKFWDLLDTYKDQLVICQIREKGKLLLREDSKSRRLKRYNLIGDLADTQAKLTAINSNIVKHTYSYYSGVSFSPLLPRSKSNTDIPQSLLQSNPDWKNVDFDPHSMQYNRVYLADFSHGGRFYADFQNLRRQERATLTIDECPTGELDYDELHPTMVYHLAGLPMTRKAYETDGIGPEMRSVLKRAVQTLFNAESRTAAIKAVRTRIGKLDVNLPEIFDAVEEAHQPIREWFYSGVGTRLQHIDSEIAQNIMVQFARMDKPCLGVHDSFIVKTQDVEILKNLMEGCYRVYMRELCRKEGRPYGEWVPTISRK